MRKITTTRFGEIEEAEDKILHFAAGLPAFEDEHEFIIVPYDEESPYVFLQSASTPDLAFLMTIPFIFFPDYEFRLEDDVLVTAEGARRLGANRLPISVEDVEAAMENDRR